MLPRHTRGPAFGIGLTGADDPSLRAPRLRPSAEPVVAVAAEKLGAATPAVLRSGNRRPSVSRPAPTRDPAMTARGVVHPLTDRAANERLRSYDQRVRQAYDAIVPTLKALSAIQHEADFEEQAQAFARERLGFELPGYILADAWVTQLDLRSLYAWCVFETYRRLADEFFREDPLQGRQDRGFEPFLLDCGFHRLDLSPCADGRLAHTLSYVLRLPFGSVKRRSYAGALFDVEDTVARWVEVELNRFREGRPNTADAPTRYLKAVVYHRSSRDPAHQGCAAHGSDDARAAAAGLERLQAFQQAVQNSFCCGASVDLLLIGLDTDTDAIQVHVPDQGGRIDLGRSVDALEAYRLTLGLDPQAARTRILQLVRDAAAEPPAEGMVRLVARLIENNLSQIDCVRAWYGGHYPDQGHAERFIGTGIGFDEIQLRNLTYFAYLTTVEEGAADLDVGLKIFSGLNLSRGLPVPVVIRFDYRGTVPGARERAVAHCERIRGALYTRYPKLVNAGLLHTMRAVRDLEGNGSIEVVGCSLESRPGGGY
jgi:carboxysome shell carbonic anhydrase